MVKIYVIRFALLCTALSFLGCAPLQSALGDVNHYRIPSDQVEQVRDILEIHPCAEGERAYVAGAEVRADGSLDLAVSCR